MKAYHRHDLAILLALTLTLGLFGIWRIHPHYAFFDSAGAVDDALLLLDRMFIKAMSKGGNAHLWLINVLAVLATPFWWVTGQHELIEVVYNWPGRGTIIRDPVANRARNQVLVLARVVSVLSATLTVAVVYRLADRLYGRRAGWLAALITVLSMGFITTAKMATEDIPMTAGLMLTLWLAVVAVDRSDRQYLVYAAMALGLTGSLKAPGAVTVLPFTVAAYWVLKDTGADLRNGLETYFTLGFVAFLAYIVTTPSALRFTELWINQMYTMTVASVGGSTYHFPDPRWLMALVQLAVIMSAPLFFVTVGASLLGFGHELRRSAVQLWRGGRLATDQRARWLFVLTFAAFGVFVGSLTSPQYFRPIPMVPLLAVMTAGAVVRLNPSTSRRIVQAGLALALVFAAIYTGTAVANWNTVRPEAEQGLDQLPENASVSSLAQELYLPRIPGHVQFRKYRDNVQQRDNMTAALTQFSNYCSDYIIIAHNHYHRYYRDPTVKPNVTAVMKPVVRLEGYRVVHHTGPPIPYRNNAEFWFEESLTLHHYANSVGNSPITVLEPEREPSAACEHRPDLYAI